MAYNERPQKQMDSNRSSKKRSRGEANANNPPQKKRKLNPPSGKGKRESAPLTQARAGRKSAPRVSAAGNGSITIKHREYIQDVNGSVAYTATSFPVNPGMTQTFPWLSTMAQLFESYRFKSLHFEYETQKSASTNGTVLLGVDYDAADSAPLTKQQLMSFEGAVRSGVWQECTFKALPASLHKFGPVKYNRSGVLAANQDIKTFDSGNLFVATQGCADATAIGELYVNYEVEFQTPQIHAAGAVSGGTYTSSTGIATATPFGTAGSGTTLGNLISSVTATAMTLQNLVIGQEYQTVYQCVCSSANSNFNHVVVGLTLVTSMLDTTVSATNSMVVATYVATATTATITPNLGTVTSGTRANFSIAPIPISSF